MYNKINKSKVHTLIPKHNTKITKKRETFSLNFKLPFNIFKTRLENNFFLVSIIAFSTTLI